MRHSMKGCAAAMIAVALIGVGLLAQELCTITVQPGESIQEAIDAASPGDVICLGPGEWEENLVIEKSLILRAAEMGSEPQAVVRSARKDWPVIRISSAEPIEVTIQGLKITGAFGACYQMAPEWICADGISVHGKAAAVIDTNTISHNVHGVFAWDASQVTIGNNLISGNEYGIAMVDASQVNIENNTISDNEWNGIGIEGSSQATITGNVIRGHDGYGVVLWERPCMDTDRVFAGYVTGSDNEGEGNTEGDYCPDNLAFLFTEEGGELDRR